MAENRLARELEIRDTAQRKQDWAPPTTLPTPRDIDGWTHRWVRTSMMGVADPTNMSAKFREGWEPVKAEDYPEMMVQADPNSRFKGNIENGGLLLCRAPSNMMRQREAYYSRQAHSQMEAVENSYMKTNDARMPLFNERRSTTSFGSGSK